MHSTVVVQSNRYVQCGSHTCSVIYVTFFTFLIVAWFIAVTSYVRHVCIHLQCKPIKYLAYTDI